MLTTNETFYLYLQAHTRLGEKVYQDFNYEVSINTLENECNPNMNSDYDKWFYNSIAHKNERNYNCSVPFHPPVYSPISGKVIEVCKDEEVGKRALSDNLLRDVDYLSG